MKKSFALLILCLLYVSSSFGQNTKRGDKAFTNGEYYKAVEEYTLLQDKITDPATKSLVLFRVAESYRQMNRPEKAEKAYSDALRAGYMSAEVYFGYGEVLMKQGKYDEAQKAFESFKRASPGDKLSEAKIASCIYAKTNQFENPRFTLQPVETINTRGSEYGIAYFNDALIYASTGNPIDESTDKNSSGKISLRTGLGYSKVYMSVPGMDGKYGKGEEAIGLNKNEKINEGTFAYDPVNRLGYYTRCDSRDNQCYIYFAEFTGNAWKEKNKLLIENRQATIGHPFVMPEGNRIYFTSRMEGGYGNADLWYTDKLPDGSWSKPINLGREVNTAGNEVFPFVSNGYLFFSSDGQPEGYGGLDIYASKLEGNVHGTAFNIGKPFNTSSDDFNLIERSDMSEGMLVSSRRGERSNDDVFRFDGFPSSLKISGCIFDSANNTRMPGVDIEVLKDGKIVDKLKSDKDGCYMLFVAPDSSYQFNATVLGYNPVSRTYKSPAERFGSADKWDLPMLSSEAYISGVITSFEKNRDGSIRDLGPLAGANVVLFANGKQVKVIRSEVNGEYRFGDIKENTQYVVRAVLKGYFSEIKTINVGKITRSTDFCKAMGFDMDIPLERIQDVIQLNNILYDFNKYILKPESLVELDKLVTLLQKNPNLKIEIRSHTDAVGSNATNDKLSQNRAKSVVDYLISRGIAPMRLTAKGYGKRELLIKKAKTDAEHAQNRRTEFKVIGETGEALYDTGMTVSQSLQAGGGYPISNIPVVGAEQPPTISTGYVPSTPSYGSGANMQNMPFRVQVTALRTLDLNKPDFRRIMQYFNLQIYAEQGPDGIYRYFAGGYNTMDEARAMANRMNAAFGTNYFPKAK